MDKKFLAVVLSANYDLDFAKLHFAVARKRSAAQRSPQFHTNKRDYPQTVLCFLLLLLAA